MSSDILAMLIPAIVGFAVIAMTAPKKQKKLP